MPGSVLDHVELRPPRDGDGDGRVHDGKPHEHDAPSAPQAGGAPTQPPPPAAPAAPPPQKLRDFGDAAAIRESIYSGVLESAASFKPLANQRHSLALSDVAYDGPGDFTLAEQKRAILEGRTLGRRLKGTWTLSDAEGNVVDRRKTTLASVPYISPRGTFIRGGNEYTLSHQLRLKPGIYTRRKDNGELESHVNVLPGTGASHRVFMEPETGRFRLGMGQAKMPLIPLLRAMGAADSTLRGAWGGDIAHENMLHDDSTVVDKLHKRLVRGEAAADAGGRAAAVRAAFESMPLDPEVNRATLGRPHAAVTLDALLDATRKLIAVNRGEAQPDDRDNLSYMTMHGPEDLLSERVGRDRMSLGRLLWKASRQGSLKSMPAGVLTRGIESAILSSGLGQPGESINPLMIYEQQGRVSRMGEGGIPSLDSVPDSSRNVQPSHLGFIDPLVTPESMKVGVDSRVSTLAMKGEGGGFVSNAFRDRQGRPLSLTPGQAAKRVIAFPGEMASGEPYVDAMVDGKTTSVPRERVDAELAHMQHAYSPVTNMVPLFSTIKPQRAVMAGRMITQALSLKDPESPHVQSGIPDEPGVSYEHKHGEQMGAVRSRHDGQVTAVSPDGISIAHAGGVFNHQLYNNFPFNRKTGIHQSPVVRVGDRVAPGTLLARSNYTDAGGTAALGRNLRVAYVPFDGHNFEDASIVSESAARKLTSEHMYQHYLEHNDNIKTGRRMHTALFAGKYGRAMLDNFDDDGVVKPGTTVDFDHPLILAAKRRDRVHGSIHRGRDVAYTDASETWRHHTPGVVTDVARTAKGTLVVVKAYSPLQVGDKLSGRQGNKGVVSRIVPDHEMPADEHGRPYEIAMNPLGTISRVNPGQHVEAALGKIAAITGRPYRLVDFDKANVDDWTAYASQELARHGMDPSSTEKVFDPVKRRWLKDPFSGGHPQTGNVFVMKLHHTAESKGQGRGTAGYTAEGMPSKGGESGSKRISLMDVNALLSHGATEVIRDAGAVRGQSQPEFWSQFMAGHNPPTPRVSHVQEKFVNQLRAAGINPHHEGTRTQLMALSNGDVDELAGAREIENADTVDWKAGMKPVPGGLFDPALTGGPGGTRWSALRLHEPMPNPVMEEPIRRMLNLTQKGFRDVLAGREPLNGRRGPLAIKHALDSLDVDRELDQVRAQVKSTRKGDRDVAMRKFGFLKSAQKYGIHPRDWMLDRVPVLPPAFRPVSVMQGSKLPMVADPNLLYKELHDANANLRDMAGSVDDLSDERDAVYDAFRGVTGLGDPLHPKNRERQVKGILKHVFGHSPKFGTVQRKLLGSTTDLVGRAVITPDPDLDMDQVGIPEGRAWEVYQPFIIRNLARKGVPRLRAVQAVKGRTGLAREALLAEMQSRPVFINRAPVLHRYGDMAFWPKLTSGETLRIPPLVVKGFGADFDGDTMQYHVPASDGAVRDAVGKMLPSRNLFAVSDFKAHQLPSQEYGGGLYTASAARDDKAHPRTFATMQDAIRAYHRGEVGVETPITVIKH